jgi:hypothetical protein
VGSCSHGGLFEGLLQLPCLLNVARVVVHRFLQAMLSPRGSDLYPTMVPVDRGAELVRLTEVLLTVNRQGNMEKKLFVILI